MERNIIFSCFNKVFFLISFIDPCNIRCFCPVAVPGDMLQAVRYQL
jgi:hypothetical protein